MAPSGGDSRQERSLSRSRRFIEVQPNQVDHTAVHNASSFAVPSSETQDAEMSGAQAARDSPSGRSRKTPHSVIERARRSRMNEEFAVLQEKLPYPMDGAYKLEILQATIEYINYLEDTVASLKARLEVETATDVRLPPLRSLLPSADGEDSSNRELPS